MALERIGLGGTLTFEHTQAVRAFRETGSAVTSYVQTQSRIPTSASQAGASVDRMASRIKAAGAAIKRMADGATRALSSMGTGLLATGAALTPISGAMGFGLKMAADFEEQMDAVSAITRANAKEFSQLEAKAKLMGATTVFTATQSAQAMEDLGRAGFSTSEIIDGLSGVMATAAADSIPLATAADIVARVIRGMGMQATDANRVSDVLALTSAKTSTAVIDLGESFKYAASQAKIMEIDLETTTALLGVAADAGLRGSVGGTSFTNMLIKLAKPSEKANEWLKKNNIEMTKTADGGLDIIDVIKQINAVLSKETDVVKKASLATELFGIRGQKAFSAAVLALKSGKLDSLVNDLRNAAGTAEEMAKTRLSNLKGQVVLLKSAIEGFAIETAGQFLKPMTEGVMDFAKQIGNVVAVLQKLQQGVTDTDKLSEEFGATTVAVARGVQEGIKAIMDGFRLVRDAIAGVVSQISGKASPQVIQAFAKWATILFIVAGAVAPILIALGGIVTFVALVVIPAFKAILVATIVVVAAAVGALGIFATAFLLLRRHGESFRDTMRRIWSNIVDWILFVVDNAIRPFWQAFVNKVQPVIEETRVKIARFIEHARNKFAQLFGGIIQAVNRLQPVFTVVFRFLGKIVGLFIGNSIKGFGLLLRAIMPVLTVLKNIGIFLIEGLVNQLQTFIKAIVKIADAVGKGDWVAPELRDFANQPKFKVDKILAVEQVHGVDPPSVAKGKGEGVEDPFGDFAKKITGALAEREGAGRKTPPIDLTVDLKDERKLDINNCLTVDGRNLAVAQARHKQEVNERAGFKATPWQRRAIMEHGAVPTFGFGGGN